MKMRHFVRMELKDRWNVRLGFQPDWHPYEGEHRHIEVGTDRGCFELWAGVRFAEGAYCTLDKVVGYAVERVYHETVWVADPQTGEPSREKKTLVFPVSDLEDGRIKEFGERLYREGGEIELEDGSKLRLRQKTVYNLSPIENDAEVEYDLVRLSEGEYKPFYSTEPIRVTRGLSDDFIDLCSLFSSTTTTAWNVVYALVEK